jgi:type II secretory pathway component GspD/PulD (secretin)
MPTAVEERTETMTIESELRQELTKIPAVAPIITNADQYAVACEAVSVRKQFIKDAKAKLDPICDAAHKAWKATTELRSSIVDPVDAEVKKIGSSIVAYDNKLRAEREAAERAAAEAARKAEEEALKANECLMPWEEAVDVVEAVQVAVQQVQEQRAPVQVPQSVAGVSTKFKPWAARVTDMDKFLRFVIESKRYELVQPDMPQLNALAKKLTESMKDTIPGTEAFRDRIISGR